MALVHYQTRVKNTLVTFATTSSVFANLIWLLRLTGTIAAETTARSLTPTLLLSGDGAFTFHHVWHPTQKSLWRTMYQNLHPSADLKQKNTHREWRNLPVRIIQSHKLVTIPKVSLLGHANPFELVLGTVGSKELPACWRCSTKKKINKRKLSFFFFYLVLASSFEETAPRSHWAIC